jgi:putative ubiquitin-RnfH superfamily antitoxin RatB of RatAB toxin-antitoxin module
MKFIMIEVELIYLCPEHKFQCKLLVKPESSILQVLEQADISSLFIRQKLSELTVGIFGKERKLTDTVVEHDRIEIYRPLAQTPNEARFERIKLERGED